MKRILIVEDEEKFLKILTKKFELEGFEVVTARNGKEGLSKLNEQSVDLILLDLLMPEMDGVTFAYHLKKMNKNIPILVLTNLTQASVGTDIREFLIKSDVSLDDVVSKVKTHLRV